MLEPLLVPAVNRLLRTNSWALDKLKPHAGKTLAVDCPPLALQFQIATNGELVRAEPGANADAVIGLTPGVLMRLAARDPTARNETVVKGDVELTGAIDFLWRHLEWDYEEDLSRVFGDIAAHRMASGFRALDRWGRTAFIDIGRAAAEYAAYESPVIASPEALDEFVRAVDEVRDAVERLEKRIHMLTRSHAPAS